MVEKITSFFKETRLEMAKVTWPSRQTIVRDTSVVIAVSLGVAAFLGLLDIFFQYILNTFIL